MNLYLLHIQLIFVFFINFLEIILSESYFFIFSVLNKGYIKKFYSFSIFGFFIFISRRSLEYQFDKNILKLL